MHAIAHYIQEKVIIEEKNSRNKKLSLVLQNNKIIDSIKAVNEKYQKEEKLINSLFESKQQQVRHITEEIKKSVPEDQILMVSEVEKIFDVIERALKRDEGIFNSLVSDAIKTIQDPDEYEIDSRGESPEDLSSETESVRRRKAKSGEMKDLSEEKILP
ncbi:hypothetical protein HK098_001727 [Nowakowskiella sp. JEL0407]|nr:hypothetical protein HK098_001727 [Nowakowskiella sp. JEL0407]